MKVASPRPARTRNCWPAAVSTPSWSPASSPARMPRPRSDQGTHPRKSSANVQPGGERHGFSPMKRRPNELISVEAAQPLRRLRRAELPLATISLARYLIGKILVREGSNGRASGRIVETEAYPPGDASGHAFHGPTLRIGLGFNDPPTGSAVGTLAHQ